MKTIYTALTLSDSEEWVDRPQFASRAQIELIWTKEDDNEKKNNDCILCVERRMALKFIEQYFTHSISLFASLHSKQFFFFSLTLSFSYIRRVDSAKFYKMCHKSEQKCSVYHICQERMFQSYEF